MAGPRQEAGGLRQKCRLADAGVAADQQHRAPDKTAAGDAIKLGHSGRQAGGLVALAGQCFQREQPALASGADRGRHRRARLLLHQRVPLVAGFALALPAAMRGAAVLADKGKCGFGHQGVTSSFSAVALRISHRAHPQPSSRLDGLDRAIQYSRGGNNQSRGRGLVDHPPEPVIGLAEGETRWRVITRRQIAISRSATSPTRTARPNPAPSSSAARRSTFRLAPG